jgi:hypothetical protein
LSKDELKKFGAIPTLGHSRRMIKKNAKPKAMTMPRFEFVGSKYQLSKKRSSKKIIKPSQKKTFTELIKAPKVSSSGTIRCAIGNKRGRSNDVLDNFHSIKRMRTDLGQNTGNSNAQSSQDMWRFYAKLMDNNNNVYGIPYKNQENTNLPLGKILIG